MHDFDAQCLVPLLEAVGAVDLLGKQGLHPHLVQQLLRLIDRVHGAWQDFDTDPALVIGHHPEDVLVSLQDILELLVLERHQLLQFGDLAIEADHRDGHIHALVVLNGVQHGPAHFLLLHLVPLHYGSERGGPDEVVTASRRGGRRGLEHTLHRPLPLHRRHRGRGRGSRSGRHLLQVPLHHRHLEGVRRRCSRGGRESSQVGTSGRTGGSPGGHGSSLPHVHAHAHAAHLHASTIGAGGCRKSAAPPRMRVRSRGGLEAHGDARGGHLRGDSGHDLHRGQHLGVIDSARGWCEHDGRVARLRVEGEEEIRSLTEDVLQLLLLGETLWPAVVLQLRPRNPEAIEAGAG
mmetsp:Transcript_44453/g.142525  ORF Transcript_44453/g.142525 Transcript_44453/m.142525 type:complete len:348 (-) Transcript_44453:154-1197(-)